MNIIHLKYFITIVENDCNLSVASSLLHISQPALTKFIQNFEKQYGIELFVKNHKRNISLTPCGNILYSKAKIISSHYDSLMSEIENLSQYSSGTIKIGIPPLIISVLFTNLISNLITKNPNIKFEIIEKGAYELKTALETGEIDIAILLQPNLINSKNFYEITLFTDELVVYANSHHPIASKRVNDKITWQSLEKENIVTFDETFLIRRYIDEKFNKYNLTPKIVTQSKSWDFIANSIRFNPFITLLPTPCENYMNLNNIISFKMHDPIEWKVCLVYEKKDSYSQLHQYVVTIIETYFKCSTSVLSFEEFLND